MNDKLIIFVMELLVPGDELNKVFIVTYMCIVWPMVCSIFLRNKGQNIEIKCKYY